MNIPTKQLVQVIGQHQFKIVALSEELTLFQLALEDAIQATSPELYKSYIWYRTMYQVKHLQIVKETLLHAPAPDLGSIQQVNQHLGVIHGQAIEDDCLDAYNQGIEEGIEGYEETTNKGGELNIATGRKANASKSTPNKPGGIDDGDLLKV